MNEVEASARISIFGIVQLRLSNLKYGGSRELEFPLCTLALMAHELKRGSFTWRQFEGWTIRGDAKADSVTFQTDTCIEATTSFTIRDFDYGISELRRTFPTYFGPFDKFLNSISLS